MIPKIDINTIISDPLLLIATILLILGPLVFLVALVKFFKSDKHSEPLPLIHEEELVASDPFAPVPNPDTLQEIPETRFPFEEVKEEVKSFVSPPPQTNEQEPVQMAEKLEKTMVMPDGMGEIQGQIEIAFSQIKTLNKKVAQMESEVETVARTASAKLDTNELKEIPMNPADFTQKLLKLAEHVIVLEKEVARMKASSKQTAPEEAILPPQPPAPHTSKSPIMPI